MYIKFIKDTFHPRKRSLTPEYLAGQVYNLPNEEASLYIEKGVAESFKINIPDREQRERAKLAFTLLAKGKDEKIKAQHQAIKELLGALKLNAKPSEKLTTLTITDKQIESFKKYFGATNNIKANDLAIMILDIYVYAKNIKDNQLLEKVSNDLLTLYRLTSFYDKNHNDRK